MTCECDYCGRHPASCGELRMCPDPDRGGAHYPTCLDCFEADLPSGDPGHACWRDLETLAEWSSSTASLFDMAQDDRAHALRDRRAGL